jgi:hypothetical protein
MASNFANCDPIDSRKDWSHRPTGAAAMKHRRPPDLRRAPCLPAKTARKPIEISHATAI